MPVSEMYEIKTTIIECAFSLVCTCIGSAEQHAAAVLQLLFLSRVMSLSVLSIFVNGQVSLPVP